MYEAMEAGGCEDARGILNAVLIFPTVYSFVDMANSAVNAKRFRDACKDRDWTDWIKKMEENGKNSDVSKYLVLCQDLVQNKMRGSAS